MRRHIPWVVVALALVLMLCMEQYRWRKAQDSQSDLRDSLMDGGRPVKRYHPLRRTHPKEAASRRTV